jgi:putative ABC transport system permease protein
VATSAGILGLIGGIVGIPVGVTLHDVILQAMAQQIGNDISPLHYQVYGPLPLSGLVLAGVAVAIVGSYLPARWAARTPVADVLHAE